MLLPSTTIFCDSIAEDDADVGTGVKAAVGTELLLVKDEVKVKLTSHARLDVNSNKVTVAVTLLSVCLADATSLMALTVIMTSLSVIAGVEIHRVIPRNKIYLHHMDTPARHTLK